MIPARSCRLAILFSFFSFMAGTAAAEEYDVASFDCGRAQGTVELRICASKELRTLDGDLGRAYEMLTRYPKDAKGALDESHKEWFRRRNEECNLASVDEITLCIKKMTVARFFALDRDTDRAAMKADTERMKAETRRMRTEIDNKRREDERVRQEERQRVDEQRRIDDRSVTFQVKSSYQYRVQLEFTSQSRSVSWPGGSQAYSLDDSTVHTYRLSCHTGEKICMGAWSRGNSKTYWGVGMNNAQSCTGCCATCGSRGVAAYNLEHRGGDDAQATSSISAADLLGAAIGVAGAVAGARGGGNYTRPSTPSGPPPRSRDSGVSGLR